MTKPLMFTTACLIAAAALALVLSVSQPHAQERPGTTPMGPGMMTPGTTPMGPGAMTPGTGPRGPGMAQRGAMARAGDGQRGDGGWRERRRARRYARRVEILDTNGDGKVTLAEIQGEQRRLLGAADVNGDGTLSVAEFRRRGRWFIRLQTISFFDMLDANGDGQISAKEITDPTARWFARHDENKDKALDGDEFSKSGWHSGRRGRRHGRR